MHQRPVVRQASPIQNLVEIPVQPGAVADIGRADVEGILGEHGVSDGGGRKSEVGGRCRWLESGSGRN